MRRLLVTLVVFVSLLGFSASGVEARQDQTIKQATPAGVTVTSAPDSEIQILSPKPGQALQGNVPVVVDTTSKNFKSVELSFGYADDLTGTRFLIFQGIQPVTGTMLVLWDTSAITDGNYTLRLVVAFTDGSQKTVLAPGIRVRNYTPVETGTPTPLPPTVTPAPANTPTVTPAPTETLRQSPPTPTPLSANPAEIGRQDVLASAGKGALAILGLFVLGGLYVAARSSGRKK